jgi:adenylate cyclase
MLDRVLPLWLGRQKTDRAPFHMPISVCEATIRFMTEKVKRRLTTVLCADVQGYSRLMEADEAGTLETLNRYRAAMAGLVNRHDGRIVNTWGDSVIAEFASVVEAVQCAAEIQQEISTQDSDRPDAQRMRFRIGINLGDVLVDGSDIYGDGVNIAARLQELAEPGGVVISGSVYEQVHHKLSLGFDCLGRQPVKNIADPVMSYRVTTSGTAPRAGAVAGVGLGAPSIRDAHALLGSMRAVADWLANLPRSIAVPLVLAGFLVLVNVFTGLHDVWFHWPVAVLLLIVVLRTLRRRPAGDRKEER